MANVTKIQLINVTLFKRLYNLVIYVLLKIIIFVCYLIKLSWFDNYNIINLFCLFTCIVRKYRY